MFGSDPGPGPSESIDEREIAAPLSPRETSPPPLTPGLDDTPTPSITQPRGESPSPLALAQEEKAGKAGAFANEAALL